jgi:hypothetical protein
MPGIPTANFMPKRARYLKKLTCRAKGGFRARLAQEFEVHPRSMSPNTTAIVLKDDGAELESGQARAWPRPNSSRLRFACILRK